MAGTGAVWLTSVALVASAPVRAQNANAAGRTVWDRVYTVEQAQSGEAQYLKSCAECHGKDLRGDGAVPALIEESFAVQWGEASVGELLTQIRTLMPSDQPNSLSAQAYANVLAFILRANGFPAGEKELDVDPEVLKQILITMKPPVPKPQ
jgi:mono/diheme cytochrome c family protein